MRQFYIVDRIGTLRQGQVLNLERFNDLKPPQLQSHVDEMFPNGVSRHGERYFLKNSTYASVASPAIELLFEYVRRAHFPERPSRFQSWFAVDSITDAKGFRNRFGQGQGAIWRVASETVWQADMNLLTAHQTTLVCSWFAHTYWRGEAGPGQTFWEFLLTPPVHVLECIAEINSEQCGSGV